MNKKQKAVDKKVKVDANIIAKPAMSKAPIIQMKGKKKKVK